MSPRAGSSPRMISVNLYTLAWQRRTPITENSRALVRIRSLPPRPADGRRRTDAVKCDTRAPCRTTPPARTPFTYPTPGAMARCPTAASARAASICRRSHWVSGRTSATIGRWPTAARFCAARSSSALPILISRTTTGRPTVAPKPTSGAYSRRTSDLIARS